MKIGLSLSRCLRDVWEGRVEENEVLVIISRTDIDPHNNEHWNNIWEGYLYGGVSNAEWAGMEEQEEGMRKLLCEMYDDGKIHQPRQFKAHPARLPYYWLECFIPDNEAPSAVKAAWDQYKVIAGLSGVRV